MILLAILITLTLALPLGALGGFALQARAHAQGRTLGIDPQSALGRMLGVVQVEPIADRELAGRMYAGYSVQAGGRTWDDKPMPTFDGTGPKVQANWLASARIARQLLTGRAS